VEEAGDEPFLMASRLPQACVVVGRDRAAGAALAVKSFGPHVFVMDDGFQYRRLAKSLEVVSLDASCLESGRLIPAGTMREGWSALRPDHVAVLLERPGHPPARPDRLDMLRRERIFTARLGTPVYLDPGGREITPQGLSEERFMLVSGIARPGPFEQGVLRAGLKAPVSVRYDDHHWYDGGDAEYLVWAMARYGCTRMLTTEKDVHKLPASLRRAAVTVRAGLEVERPGDFAKLLEAVAGGI
jgi:tetraacyldisaccharide 4'-kinase